MFDKFNNRQIKALEELYGIQADFKLSFGELLEIIAFMIKQDEEHQKDMKRREAEIQ